MTINPIDMQVIVPRAGEVERVNRTVQGQQQTDQQIQNQVIKDELQRQQQTVNELDTVKQGKIQNEEKKKQRESREQQHEESTADHGEKSQEKLENSERQNKDKKGRYIDIRV
ncbi:MAG: hypothetical protein ACOX2X_04310 [Peptococcia bacterium]|jgi:hypothetical protein